MWRLFPSETLLLLRKFERINTLAKRPNSRSTRKASSSNQKMQWQGWEHQVGGGTASKQENTHKKMLGQNQNSGLARWLSRWTCLSPNLMTWVWCPELTSRKKRTDCFKLSSNRHTLCVACACTHTHTHTTGDGDHLVQQVPELKRLTPYLLLHKSV